MTPYQSPPPVAPQTPPASMPVDPSTLSVEEQARMFRDGSTGNNTDRMCNTDPDV